MSPQSLHREMHTKALETTNRPDEEEDIEDEPTVRTPGVRIERPQDKTNNRENDTSNVATFALAESGVMEGISDSGAEIKSADKKMEMSLVQDALQVIQKKVEAGRDPNELLVQTLEELHGAEDEIEDLLEGDQLTVLKDAQMRKARLAAQAHWLRAHLSKEA